LKTVELVLVDHMDDVLRRALLLDDPESLFRKKAPPPAPLPQAFPAPDPTADVVAH
jgi:ATP-dependent Lon protease